MNLISIVFGWATLALVAATNNTSCNCVKSWDTQIVCEHGTANLSCQASENVIKIISANYGRNQPGSTICPHSSIKTTNCSTIDHATNIVASNCNGQTTCQVPASNSVFGDPCVGTYKYLTVQYTCVPACAILKK